MAHIPKERCFLLLEGMEVRILTVNWYDKNPHIVKTPDSPKEVQTTKLIIANLPISNDEIERKLVQLGCEPQSKLMMERDRDERGGLTRWLTGRRFVYIRIPDRALPEKISTGSATATLYHRGEKNKPENSTCSRRFTKGHPPSSCTNDVVLRTCRQPGHKSGHPSCPLPTDNSSSSTVVKRPQTSGTPAPAPDSGDVEPDQGKTTAATTTTTTTTAMLPPPATPLRPGSRRGRESTQSTLNCQGRSQSVPREKRPSSSPTQQPDSAKAARTGDRPLQPRDPNNQEAPAQGGGDPAVTLGAVSFGARHAR